MDEFTINPLFSKIEERAKEVGFKDITALCAASKASRGALTDLKYGRTKDLSVKTIEKLAPALQVSIEFFASGGAESQKEKLTTENGSELDEETIELKEIWDTSDADERAALLEMARLIKKRRN